MPCLSRQNGANISINGAVQDMTQINKKLDIQRKREKRNLEELIKSETSVSEKSEHKKALAVWTIGLYQLDKVLW